MCQDLLRVIGVPPVHEESETDSKCWVEGGTGVPADGAESPKNETDGGDSINAEIWANSVFACNVENEEYEDECADNLHVESGPVLAHDEIGTFDSCFINLVVSDLGGEK